MTCNNCNTCISYAFCLSVIFFHVSSLALLTLKKSQGRFFVVPFLFIFFHLKLLWPRWMNVGKSRFHFKLLELVWDGSEGILKMSNWKPLREKHLSWQTLMHLFMLFFYVQHFIFFKQIFIIVHHTVLFFPIKSIEPNFTLLLFEMKDVSLLMLDCMW